MHKWRAEEDGARSVTLFRGSDEEEEEADKGDPKGISTVHSTIRWQVAPEATCRRVIYRNS
jgi:hypothetical protein